MSIDGRRHPVDIHHSMNPLSGHILTAINPTIDIVYDYGKNKSDMIDSMDKYDKEITKLISLRAMLIQNICLT